jgi:hypothetical protein
MRRRTRWRVACGAYDDPIGVGIAARLERGLATGTAMIGTSPPEARVLLTVIEAWTPERLREVADSLRKYAPSP